MRKRLEGRRETVGSFCSELLFVSHGSYIFLFVCLLAYFLTVGCTMGPLGTIRFSSPLLSCPFVFFWSSSLPVPLPPLSSHPLPSVSPRTHRKLWPKQNIKTIDSHSIAPASSSLFLPFLPIAPYSFFFPLVLSLLFTHNIFLQPWPDLVLIVFFLGNRTQNNNILTQKIQE